MQNENYMDLKLDKGMYLGEGTFSEKLAALDPDEDYIGTPLRHMKSYSVGAPLLDAHCMKRLNMIEPENPNYLLSRRLLKILHYLVPAPKKMLDEIPPLSILREFIGGCTFYAK